MTVVAITLLILALGAFVLWRVWLINRISERGKRLLDPETRAEYERRGIRRFHEDGRPWLKFGASPGLSAGTTPPKATPDPAHPGIGEGT